MPDKDGNVLPPIADETFDGEKQSVKLDFPKCKHNMEYVKSNEIRCTKCGVGYTDTAENIKRLYELLK